MDGFEAGDPHPGGFFIFFRFLAGLTLQVGFLVLVGRLLAVTMVGFVVECHDVFHAHQLGHDPLEHLSFALQRLDLRASPPEERTASFRDLQRFPPHEGVVIGDDDFRAVQVAEHVAGHEFAARVVAVRVVWFQDPQPITDRQSRGDDQKAACKLLAALVAHGVDRLPRDNHGHDGGLAGASREFQCQPVEAGIGLFVGRIEMIEKSAPLSAELRRNLGQPDDRLDGFDLTEEGPDIAETVMPPMLQELGGLRRDAPLARVRQPSPGINAATKVVDDVRQIILLTFRLDLSGSLVEHDLALGLLVFSRLGDGRDERDGAPFRNAPVCRLAVLIQFPVLRWVLVGRVQDRLVEEPHSEGDSGQWPVTCFLATDHRPLATN